MHSIERAVQALEEAALKYVISLTDLADARQHGVRSSQYTVAQQTRDARYADLEQSVRDAVREGVLVAQVARIADWPDTRVYSTLRGEKHRLPLHYVSRTEAMTALIRELQRAADEYRRSDQQWQEAKSLARRSPHRVEASQARMAAKEVMRAAALRALDAQIAPVRVERITGWSHVQMWRLRQGETSGSAQDRSGAYA
ncbi:hypothetical protein [Streptomyces sp. NBC_00878]|uniref:hypothetical protein n=1 Tax=Streptomyces sp. NBC_00878 TaxID=2975854 RepID=UPI002258D413|nr:hypothetical protein [Streptomyces sp. NBC_00878]MCX4911916.1 hypothetical protein [Streptomyces sp. NBC_00878]